MVYELSGIGIRPWVDRILFYMGKRLKYIPDLKKLLHSRNVLNMHREYMALIASGQFKKADKVSGSGDFIRWNKQTYKLGRKIAERTNLPLLFILNFFSALYNLASVGEIPAAKYDPVGYTKSKILQQTIPTEKGLFKKTSETVTGFGKAIVPLTVAVAVLGALVLVPRILPTKT